MKKFATLSLIILSLFSCVLFSACGDKYKKLQMEIIFTDGNAVTNLELVLDSANESKATERLGVKFSGIDNDDIGQVVVYSSPNDVVIISNEVYSENYFYFDVTAVKVADSETQLVVKHLASGKTQSVGLKIDQKAQSLTATTNKYIVAVNEAKVHTLNSKQLVYLQPSSSTDKVYFEETDENNIVPTGVKKITETIDGKKYITGFEILSNALSQAESYNLIPVTKMDGYLDKEWTDKIVEIYFSNCLNNKNVYLDTDIKHKDENDAIYETIYLIANDTNANGTYCYNNVLFNLETRLGDISNYLNDYTITVQDNSTAIQSSHIGNGQFVVQAVAPTEEKETVNFVLTPKNMVGDVEVITKSVVVKGEVRSNTIEAKKKDTIVDTSEIVDIYNYLSTGNSNGIKFNFNAVSKENITVFEDLSKMRIEISPEILYLNVANGYYTNAFKDNKDNEGKINSTETTIGENNLANQKKLISIVKGNDYLKFTYDSVKQKFVSELFSSSDNLYIKYVETDNTEESIALRFDVVAGYEGELNYLKDITPTRITLNFNTLEGVVNLEIFAGSRITDGNTNHNPVKVDGSDDFMPAETIYIDRSSVTALNSYELIFKDISIKGLGNRYLYSDVEFDVDIIYSNSIKNPITLECGNKLEISNLLAQTMYVGITVADNTSIGEYTIVFSQPDTGFEKRITCFVYKEFTVADLTLNFASGNLDDEAFKNYSFVYNEETHMYDKKYTYEDYEADYIVYAGKSLNLTASINEDVLNSNIIKNYVYTPTVLDAVLSPSTDLQLDNYFNKEVDPHMPEFSRLNFINRGTVIDGNVYYISYKITIETRRFTNILTEDKTQVNSADKTITFFVYERIVDGTNIKASLNYPVLEKYMANYIGEYNKADSTANLVVSMTDENLWNYVQPVEGFSVNWEHNLENNNAIDFNNKQDKSVNVTFYKNGNLENYNCNIIAKIKQFNKTIELRSSVLVKKPVLTEELKLTNNLPTFEKVSKNSKVNQIFEYNLDLRKGEEFTVTAEHISSTGKVTHTGVTLVVANAGGGTVQDAIQISGNTIKVNGIQSNLHLIVYSTDVLNANVRNYTSGFNKPEQYILDGEEENEDMFKGAYFIINLHLEDGVTKETAYRVYNLTDFEEMLNSTEKNKYYQIMNDINLTGLKTFNKEFSGYIFSENNSTLYDINLNNTNMNLFKLYTGSVENVNFEVKYNYSNFNNSSNLGLIGELESLSTLTNVGVTISGNSSLNSSVDFGGLVGVNNGTIQYSNENVGVTGNITLSGNGNINFGGLVGKNSGSITGTNKNKTTFDGTKEISFANSSSTQGAVCNITINANGLTGTTGNIGGLVGSNAGTISQVYVVGTINAKQYNNVGGVVGHSSRTETGTYTYNSGTISYSGTESPVLSNVKSGVIVNGHNNVGGIVGADSYGLYYNCWYQILPTTGVAISGNEKVGGIVGFSTHSKLQFCSVMSYRYDYSNETNYIASLYADSGKTSYKLSDIVGLNYVAGLVGYVEDTGIGTLDGEVNITSSTIVRNSSVNAVVDAGTGAVGGIYTTQKENISGFIYSSYFIGRLVGNYTCDTNDLCLDNNGSGNYDYCYSLRDVGNTELTSGKTTESNFTIIDSSSLLAYWNKSSGINLNYIYVSNAKSDNQPIFDLVPTSFTVKKEELNLYYYDFSSNGLEEDTLNSLNSEFNIYKIKEKLAFDFAPASKIMVSVMSSDTNVIIVNASEGTIQVLATGSAILTFTPVLNPSLSKEIKVDVTRNLSGIQITQDGTTKIDSLKLQNGKTKQLQIVSTGVQSYNGVQYYYKSTNEYGLLVSIKWNSGVNGTNNKYYGKNKIISSYIKLNNATIVSGEDSETEYVLFVPYGTTLSFTAIAVGGDFDVSIQACVDKTFSAPLSKYADATAKLNLQTMRGAYGIAFDYDYAIVYPNDETNLIATITTDVELDETEIKKLIYSIVLNNESLASENYSTYIELLSVGEFNSSKNTQTAIFKINISAEFEKTETSTPLKINFKTDYTAVQTVEYTILPQRIDKIEAKSYIKTVTDGSTTYEDTDVLKPNSLGMLAIDISPINGYFDYLEIDDITGNEEIKFIQLDRMGGNSLLDVDTPSSSNKGIRLVKVDGKQTIYVSMQIDRKYSSKMHTLKISAYYKDGTVLKTDYKYIDVKMLPIVNVEYQLPNGESKYYETQTTNSTEKVDNLYFAIGTSAQFRITTSNATSPLKYSISADSDNAYQGTFTLVNTHDDFYSLTNTTINSSDLGKKVIIQLQAESIINNNIETATLNLEFTIVKYVIHSVSVTSSNSKGEIYGNFNISSNLELYLKETDISFYNNGGYNNLTYRYDSASTSTNEAIKSINNILKELNENYNKYLILNYGYNNEYTRTVPSGAVQVADATPNNETKKYITDTTKLVDWKEENKDKVKLTREDGKIKLLVQDGYYKDSYLAVDMELELDTNYLWSVQPNITTTSIDLSKNYLLNFNKAYEEDDYQLIRNEEDFLAMTDGESNRYILGNNLVLENYSPMDVNIAEFDGNGRTITIKSFASFTEETISAGLFAQIYENMIVKNVNVEYSTKRVETVYSFGYAKTNNNSSKVKDFTVEYADICNDYTVNYTQATFGGLTAINNGIVTNCTVSGTIAMRASTIETNKTSTSNGYSIAFNIGGLVGENSSTGYITNSSSGLQIFALANIGGLVYKNEGKIVSSAVEDNALIYSYNINLEKTILVEVGGFVAQNTSSGSISMSHTTLNYDKTSQIVKGFMSTKDESAGFVYSNAGKIKNCYVQIAQIGDHNNVFCGFVYTNSGSISTCYTSINKGECNISNAYMFSQAGTNNLENCLEFVYIKNGYITNQSTGLTTVGYGLILNDRQAVIDKFTENNFVFGSTNSAVWKMEDTDQLPLLVACVDKVRYTENKDSSGNSYFGLRNITYEQEQIKNEDGSTSLEWKVKFNDDSYGSASNPYIIANLENWVNRFIDGSTKYYRIVADIEFSSYLNPTTSTISFSGNIQGNDMVLSNFKLYLQEDVESIGLFKSLTSADDISIDNSVRNLTLKPTSGWASKADAFGVLSGKAIGFNLYNITVDNSNEVVVGGNAVGGVVGYLAGKFDVDGISSNIGANSTRELSAYRYNIYQGTVNKTTSNLSSVYYAGSVFGVVDGYDYTDFKLNDERYLDSTYYILNHITVDGNPILIGDTVGAICGFIGERVKLINSNVNLTSASFKGYQYSAGLVGENRGVIDNAIVRIGDNAFDEANYSASGLVGLNIGGLIRNVDIEVNIIRSGNVSVGGIVARNINGIVADASFDGEIFGMVTGGVMASNYNYDIFTQNAGAGGIKDSSNLRNVIPNSVVEYRENHVKTDSIKFANIEISSKCLNYFIEHTGNFYSYDIEVEYNNETNTSTNKIVQDYYRAFGLFAGYEYSSEEVKDSSLLKIYYDNGKIVLNGSEENVSEENKIVLKQNIKVECKDNMLIVSTGENAQIWFKDDENGKVKTFSFDIPYLATIQIVGADVSSFDSWDKKAFSKNYVVFGNISGFDA